MKAKAVVRIKPKVRIYTGTRDLANAVVVHSSARC